MNIEHSPCEKSPKLINVGHPPIQKQETFFSRTVFRSVSKVCGPTFITLSKWSN